METKKLTSNHPGWTRLPDNFGHLAVYRRDRDGVWRIETEEGELRRLTDRERRRYAQRTRGRR